MVIKRILFSLIVTNFIFIASSAAAVEQSKTNIESKNSTNESNDMMTQEKKLSDMDFLEANKKKDDVVTLPDGLQYKIIKEGSGAMPKTSDTVTVHYRGTHVDGTEFDSSYERGEPANFPVNAVIAGWTEALQLMKVGSIWELYIPGSLAYGEYGMPPVIAPNETLVFKVELLAIK